MFPDGLNRASVANPVYAVCAPSDRPTTLSIGEADGVASNSAVNEPVCCEIAKFCHPPPEVTVAHPTPCNGLGASMPLPVTTVIPIPKLAIVTPTSRKQINEKRFLGPVRLAVEDISIIFMAVNIPATANISMSSCLFSRCIVDPPLKLSMEFGLMVFEK